MVRDEEVLREFGVAVAKARSAHGWSQRVLADRLSQRGLRVDATAVSRIESGSRSLKLGDAIKVADALDVELDALVTRSRSPLDQWFALQRASDRALAALEVPLAHLVQHILTMIDYAAANPDVPINHYSRPEDLQDSMLFEATHDVRGFDILRNIDEEETDLIVAVVSANLTAQIERSNEALRDLETRIEVDVAKTRDLMRERKELVETVRGAVTPANFAAVFGGRALIVNDRSDESDDAFNREVRALFESVDG